MTPFLVLGFWDKNTGICAGAMPGFSGHYQDRGISSLEGHDSACNVILSVATSQLGVFCLAFGVSWYVELVRFTACNYHNAMW